MTKKLYNVKSSYKYNYLWETYFIYRFAKAFNDGLRESVRRLRKSFRSTNGTPRTINPTTQIEDGSNSQPPIYLNIFNESSDPVNQTISVDTRQIDSPPPEYATIDPRRTSDQQRTKNDQSDPTRSPTQNFSRNDSITSTLRRNITQGLRSSVRRIAEAAGASSQTDTTNLVSQISSENLQLDVDTTASEYAYANMGTISQSEA